MSEKTYRLQGAAALSVPAADADRLLELKDGECALLYLHVLRTGGELIPELAERTLGRSQEEIRAAAARLSRAGLLSSDGPNPPAPGPDELRPYAPDEIVRRTDGGFRALLEDTQRLMGRTLSGSELQTLFGIYDQLAMPPEVVMLLIHYVADRLRARYGERRLPTMRAIEKEAYRWARLEILTLEQANAYVAELERRSEEMGRVRQALGLTGREIVPSERKYLEDWLEKGFTAETLALAYDRTVTRTGKLSWAYMDRIVQSWYGKKLFTPEAIEKGDPPFPAPGGKTPARRGGGRPAAEKPIRDDLDDIWVDYQDKQ